MPSRNARKSAPNFPAAGAGDGIASAFDPSTRRPGADPRTRWRIGASLFDPRVWLSLDQEAFALRLLSRSVNQSLSHRNFSMDPYCFCISSGDVFKYSGLFSGTAIAIERSPQTSAAGSGERHAE
jgi:hypothetical protein